MWRFKLVTILILTCSLPLNAEDNLVPGPTLSPEKVVEIQLQALQHNNDPYVDAGIETTWAFAHPNNKRVTGPIERFGSMIKNPAYKMLLNHRSHEIRKVAVTEETALFAVTIEPASGPTVFYQWRLKRVEAGEHTGAWMTTAVSAPVRSSDTI